MSTMTQYELAQAREKPNIVVFDVGGRHFSVAKSTLMFHPECLLAKMVEHDWGTEFNESEGGRQPQSFKGQCQRRRGTAERDGQDSGSPLFIDRDPELFDVVLNYLRTSRFAIASNKDVSLHALQQEAEYYNLRGLAAAVSSYRNPPYVLYSVSRTGHKWESAATRRLRINIQGEDGLRQIVGTRPFEDLKRFASESLRHVEEVCERENQREAEVDSGCSWSIAGVQFGQDPSMLFLVYLQRNDSRAENDVIHHQRPATLPVDVKPKKVHVVWSFAAHIAAVVMATVTWMFSRRNMSTF